MIDIFFVGYYKIVFLIYVKNNIFFVGRFANYKYFNMDKAISATL